MPRRSYYYQDCPKCGRTLQVRVEYLGRKVVCQHCKGTFAARDPNNEGISLEGVRLLDRANELLDTASVRAARPR